MHLGCSDRHLFFFSSRLSYKPFPLDILFVFFSFLVIGKQTSSQQGHRAAGFDAGGLDGARNGKFIAELTVYFLYALVSGLAPLPQLLQPSPRNKLCQACVNKFSLLTGGGGGGGGGGGEQEQQEQEEQEKQEEQEEQEENQEEQKENQ